MEDKFAQPGRRWCRPRLFVSVVLLVGAVGLLHAQSGAAGAFDRLKALEGKWAGKAPDGQVHATTFHVTAGGSAVLQMMMEGTEHEMPTLYHMDGDRLMATHYCAAKNQPRMVLPAADASGQTLRFQFLDVTNLATPDAGHMRTVTFTFLGPNKLRQDWTYREKGKDSVESFEVDRQP